MLDYSVGVRGVRVRVSGVVFRCSGDVGVDVQGA